MRKLVTVRKVDAINPIPDADKIEVATVGGWKVVINKGALNVGDLAAFFEIDSFLPNWPEFQFLGKPTTFNGQEGFRLRTVKLRKQISQGLLLPLSDFAQFDNIKFEEGQDITDYLEVVKWERPAARQPNNQQAKGTFPYFIQKTDEERVQNIPMSELEKYKSDWFVETVKLDGSSMTVFVHSKEEVLEVKDGFELTQQFPYTGVCSRNQELKEIEGNSFWDTAKKYGITERLITFFNKHERCIAIQGELYGEGIQNNPWKISGKKFAVFNIWSIDDQRYLSPSEVVDIIEELNLYKVEAEPLQHVPVVREGILGEMFELTHEAILARADEIYDMIAGRPTEGFVYKLDSRTVPYYSFKAISNKYLLKNGD